MEGYITAIIVILCIIALFIILKVYIKLSRGWDRSATCLVGKTIIVTGANSGIGYWTALDFAKRGGRVILACRDPKRAEEARANIVEATGNPNVVVKLVDLGSLSSVREFAKDINATEPRLDILVNNAGAGGLGHVMTPDGMSITMQINHFGPFLLTLLLVELLKKSAPSRIINVSSELAHHGRVNLDDLNGFPGGIFKGAFEYMKNKLCNVLFTNELARRLQGTGVVANSIEPGAVKTEFFKNLSSVSKAFANTFADLFYRSAEEGAQTSIYAAVSKEINGVSGAFFGDCKKKSMPKRGRDLDFARRLWEKSEEFVKLTPEEKVL